MKFIKIKPNSDDSTTNSLLDKAKAYQNKPRKSGERVTDEQIELALAWARGEITGAQVRYALGARAKQGVGYYVRLALILGEYVRRNS